MVAIVLIILIAGQWIIGTGAVTPRRAGRRAKAGPRVIRVLSVWFVVIVGPACRCVMTSWRATCPSATQGHN